MAKHELSVEMLRAVLESLPIRLFWKDAQSRYLGCNHAFAEDAGIDRDALIGKTDFDISPETQARAYRADDREVIDSGVGKLGIEEPVILPDGRHAWVETNKLPLRDAHGAVIGVLCAYHDITARVEMREERLRLIDELIKARDVAERGSAEKSRFLANMSHELRTPLNAIIGYGELIKEDVASGDPAEPQDLDRILGAARHLLTLINDLLDLSKIEAGRVQLNYVEIDAVQLIDDLIVELHPLAAANNVTLTHVMSDADPAIKTDPTKLRQCLLNLVSNACKFSKGGNVDIALERIVNMHGGDSLSITVRDNGIGMSDEQMRKLFQPFAQADESIAHEYGGTGLGLAITKELITMLGGEVSVVSKLGQGATFTLRLPVCCPDCKHAKAA